MKRDDAEYVRGREAGYQVASKALKVHDRDRVEADAREMRTDARKRGSDPFDRGYALGYMDALRGLHGNRPEDYHDLNLVHRGPPAEVKPLGAAPLPMPEPMPFDHRFVQVRGQIAPAETHHVK